MKVIINSNISKEYKEESIEIKICASELTQEIKNIIEKVQEIGNKKDIIIGRKGNTISIIEIKNIIKIYSKEQNNFCKTTEGEYQIKKKLYELEQELDNNYFIRISNSCIINIRYVECFDLGMVGNIVVNFKDKTKEYVSKRRISKILKFLKERGD